MINDDENKSNLIKSYSDIAPYIGLGTQLAITIVVMFFLGRWLDQKLDWTPILTITFSFIGGFGGIYNFIKTVLDLNERKKINSAIIFTIACIITIALLYFFQIIDQLFLNSAIYAILFNIINFVAAVYLFKSSLGKSNNTFLIKNLGGMGLRLIILLLVIFISLKFLNIDRYGFILVFFIFYFVYLILEINFFRLSSINKGY
jgi:F0F1-type ATP synthase assembly protein I